MTTTTTTTDRNERNGDSDIDSTSSSPSSSSPLPITSQAHAAALNAALTRRRTTTNQHRALFPLQTRSTAATFLPQKFSVNDDDEDSKAAAQLPTQRNATYIWSSLIAGMGSGVLASIVCAPLDVLRTRLQVWGDLSGQRASGIHVVKDILGKEGWKGGFRGLGATLLTVPCFWGLYFPLYNDLKQRLQTRNRNPSLVHCLSAILAGGAADVVCNPMWVVRTRLQTEALHGTMTPSGICQTTRALYVEGGLPIFWRGLTASLFGLTHVAVQFPLYEWLKARARSSSHNNKEDAIDILVASGLSKMCASLLTYPHEVVRSRMMDARTATAAATAGASVMAGHSHSLPPSLTKTIQRIYAHEGIHGFYTGLHVSLLRVVPNCCITFLTYELLLQWANRQFERDD